MRINNNIMAFNAQRNLGTSASSMAKSIEKLSSGLRINRAADDASGLVISQKLRAQTSGLRQATRNAQDGISVVQTAEGALNEVHSMLNRMRDLAVQAANTGANDATARGAAQQELSQLRTEIDRIGNTTSSSAIACKLLNQSAAMLTGRGTGIDEQTLQHKIDVINLGLARHQSVPVTPWNSLRCFGGLDRFVLRHSPQSLLLKVTDRMSLSVQQSCDPSAQLYILSF